MNRKKLILPFVLAAFVVLQCFSSPIAKHSWMSLYSPARDVDDEDEDEFYDPRLRYPDSVLLSWPSDSLLFYADSLMHVYAIDSTGFTQMSELYMGDTDRDMQAKVDSIFRARFIQDSVAKAELEFQRWFDSIPKKERKRWIQEHVTIPAQRRKLDSMLHRKDSIQAYKDSVLENTPRILDTRFIPDSLLYKRIVKMTNNKRSGDFRIEKFDTTYNYHFYDYPFMRSDVNAVWLGAAGSPAMTYDVSKRQEEENAIFFTTQRLWTYDANSMPTYNTKTPYTELGYYGTPFNAVADEELNARFLTTQNITPELNISLEINKYGTGSKMVNQKTDAMHLGIGINYLGKKYALHAGYLRDKTTAKENGGFVRLSDVRDTTLKTKELEVNLNNANSQTERNLLFLNHSLRIPFGKDSTSTTTAFIGHTTEWAQYKRLYDDNISDKYGRAFYSDVFLINPNKSADSLGVMRLDNRVYLRLQPWKEDFFISKIEVGVGDKLLSYRDRLKKEDGNGTYIKTNYLNNIYTYAGARGMVGRYFNWDATAQLYFAGYQIGDFNVDANAAVSFYPFRRDRNAPITLRASFHTDLTEPDHYQQQMLLNHFQWNNKFGKQSTSRITGTLEIPRWKLDLNVGYNILANALYYDHTGIIRQAENPVNVITASLRKEFVIWKLHFDNRVLAQFSSDNAVVPVPLVALNLKWFGQFDLVKNVLQAQIGVQGTFNTKWAMPSYNPELGVFYNQNVIELGNTPVMDAFINLQWKRACIFLKLENLANGGPGRKEKDYFTAMGYIHTQRAFKVGITWPFYVQPKRKSTGSSTIKMGGGGGGSKGGGLLGGLGGLGGGGLTGASNSIGGGLFGR